MTKPVQIIGAPVDYGANRRGVDMGPSAIRYAGLAEELANAGITAIDTGDLSVPRAEERDPETHEPNEGKAKFLRETADACERLADKVAGAIEDDAFPLVLGGDHSIAMGTLGGAARDAEIGAIWFDAHSDFNTPKTSPSGNVHGMPLAGALAVDDFANTDWANVPGLRAENVVLVGLRSVDGTETDAIEESGVTTYTMSDIDEFGISEIVDEALDIATDGVDGIHVSFDMDWLDPKEAPGVGTPVRGGASYREAHSALETVATRDREENILRSLEFVEVNPILDEHNETAELSTELAASALGKRIL